MSYKEKCDEECIISAPPCQECEYRERKPTEEPCAECYKDITQTDFPFFKERRFV